jgi:hypothetical protein
MLTARDRGCPQVAARLWPQCGPAPAPLAPLRWRPSSALLAPPSQLGKELIGGVLIPGEQPRLAQLAVANMGHQHVPGLKGLPLTLASGHKQRDRVLVVGHHIMKLGSEGTPVSSIVLAK